MAEIPFQGDVEGLIPRAAVVVGEVQRLIDQHVQIDRPSFPGRPARMTQDRLHDAEGNTAETSSLIFTILSAVAEAERDRTRERIGEV